MLSRRYVLQLFAAAGAPTIARRAGAALGPGFRAVALDGDTFYANPGNIPSLPAFTAKAAVVFSFAAASLGSKFAPIQVIFGGYIAPNSFQVVFVKNYISGVAKWTLETTLTDANNQQFAGFTPIGAYLDGNFHTVCAGIDGGAQTVTYLIDGVVKAVTLSSPPPGGYKNLGCKFAGRPIYIGNVPSNAGGGFPGSLAELYLYASNHPDFSIVLAGFWDAKNQTPVRQDASGQWAASSPGGPPVPPDVYLSGGAADWLNNGAAATWQGMPGKINANYPFTLAAGTLVTNTNGDPWNQPAGAAISHR